MPDSFLADRVRAFTHFDPAAREAGLEELRVRARHFGLDKNLLVNLVGNSHHWSFLLQLSALLEMAVDRSLARRLGVDEGTPSLHRMNLQQRAKFAHELSALDDRAYSVAIGLAELRNQYTHDPKMIGRDLRTHISQLPRDGQLKIGAWVSAGFGFKATAENRAEAVRVMTESLPPTWIILHAALYVVDRAFFQELATRRAADEAQFFAAQRNGRWEG